jgi:hypothetical protein
MQRRALLLFASLAASGVRAHWTAVAQANHIAGD